MTVLNGFHALVKERPRFVELVRTLRRPSAPDEPSLFQWDGRTHISVNYPFRLRIPEFYEKEPILHASTWV